MPTTDILITGATGRIGANIAKHMVELGHNVRALVLPDDPEVEKISSLGIEPISGDITSFEDVRRSVDGVNVVFHLGAAFQAGGPFTPEQYMQANVQATFHIFEAARECGTGLRQVVFSSTDATLDKYPVGGNTKLINETNTTQMQTDWYGFSKILGERIADRFVRADRLPVTVVRFPMVWGAGEFLQFEQFRLAYFVEKFEARNDVVSRDTYSRLCAQVADDDSLVVALDANGRSWMKHTLDVRDISDAFEQLLGNECVIGNTYQLGAPSPFSWAEVVPAIAGATGERVVEVRLAGIVPTFYEFDLSAARRDFGYTPSHGWESTLAEAIRYTTTGRTDIVPTRL